MLDSPLKLSDVLARAEAGDEHAREIVRSGGLVSVCRMTGSSGETRSLPEEVRVAPPRVGRAGRREPRDVGGSVAPPVVTFARQAWTDLRDEVYEYDGDEHGGALFGRRDGDAVVVERICGSSAWAERAATHFTIERDPISRSSRRCRTAGTGSATGTRSTFSGWPITSSPSSWGTVTVASSYGRHTGTPTRGSLARRCAPRIAADPPRPTPLRVSQDAA
jgi:hypothetical protein